MDFAINNTNTEAMGVSFSDPVYAELLKPAKAKDTLFNDWPDEHGTERDLESRVYETRVLNLPVILQGNSVADFTTKLKNFNALMLLGYFNLKAYSINRQFTLCYSEATNFNSYDTFCTFTLVVFDDYPNQNLPI